MRQARIYTSQYGTAETTSHAVAAMKQMRKLLVPGIIVALSSCGGGNAVTAPPNPLQAVSGTYALTQYNGNTLPGNITQADLDRLVTVAGTLVLRDDNRFVLRSTLVIVYSAGFIQNIPPGAVPPLPQFARGDVNGTYMVSGSSITLSWNDGRYETLTGVTGDVLTINDTAGSVYTYQKE